MGFGSTLLADVIGGLVTGLVLTILVAWRDAFQRTVANDAVVGDLLEDTARFVRDRNRLLAAQMVADFEAALRVNLQESVEHASSIASLKRQVLHEYRDEITRKRRRYRDVCNSEGVVEVVVRHYRTAPLQRYALTDFERSVVEIWRAPVGYEGDRSVQVDDPTASEPGFRVFEERGDPAHYVRSVEVRELA